MLFQVRLAIIIQGIGFKIYFEKILKGQAHYFVPVKTQLAPGPLTVKVNVFPLKAPAPLNVYELPQLSV